MGVSNNILQIGWQLEDQMLQMCMAHNSLILTRLRMHLWPDAGCIHQQRPTNIV